MTSGEMWLEKFATWLRAGGVSKQTVRVRLTYVRSLLAFVGDPVEATGEQLAEWLADPGWKPSTRRQALGSARVFYHWLVDAGVLDKDPTRSLRQITVPRGLPRPVPEEALERAIETAKEPLGLAILLGAYAGLRRAEIANLHADDIGLTHITIRGKGGKSRRVPIAARLAEPLVEARARGGWVFPSPLDPSKPISLSWMGQHLSEALPEGFSGHTLRHRFGTAVYRGTKDLRATQQLLGHASIATTQIYVDVSDDALIRAVSCL